MGLIKMDKEEIRKFFDKWAERWDSDMVIDDEIINTIMDSLEVKEGCDVLDVASGTGVLIPYYLTRNVKSVTAVDLSGKMTEIASHKFKDNNKVNCLNQDIYDHEGYQYDCIMVYNSLPHFADPEQLVAHLTGLLKEGGRLTVAHGASREKINRHHGNVTNVSRDLLEIESLADIFSRYLTVKEMISDDKMYMITGIK